MVKDFTDSYIAVSRLDHYGEHAVPTRKKRFNHDGTVEVQFIMLDCRHGHHKVWLTRKDITYAK